MINHGKFTAEEKEQAAAVGYWIPSLSTGKGVYTAADWQGGVMNNISPYLATLMREKLAKIGRFAEFDRHEDFLVLPSPQWPAKRTVLLQCGRYPYHPGRNIMGWAIDKLVELVAADGHEGPIRVSWLVETDAVGDLPIRAAEAFPNLRIHFRSPFIHPDRAEAYWQAFAYEHNLDPDKRLFEGWSMARDVFNYQMHTTQLFQAAPGFRLNAWKIDDFELWEPIFAIP